MSAPDWSWLVTTPEFDAAAGADWADGVMIRPVTDRFHAKQSRNVGRLALTGGGQSIVVYLKRHFEPPSKHGQGLDGDSPARGEFDHLEWARSRNLPVPRVLAAGERVFGRSRQSFIALEELTGMLALHELLPFAFKTLQINDFTAFKSDLGREVARLAAELHRRGAFHQDLYLCHFYAKIADVESRAADFVGRVTLIDFHRLTHATGPRAAWLRVKDLAQLRFSAVGVAGIEPDDISAVYAEYRRLTGVGWLTGKLAAWKADRYLAHNLKAS